MTFTRTSMRAMLLAALASCGGGKALTTAGTGGGGAMAGGADGGAAAGGAGGAAAGSSGGAAAGSSGGAAAGGGGGAAAGSSGGAVAGGAGGVTSGGAGGSTGGAGGGGEGGAAAPPGGIAWEPWPQVDPAPSDVCQVTRFIGGDVANPRPETWQYDAATRILTRRHAAAAGQAAWVGYVRVDAQGRREIACSVTAPIYCQEWIRDSGGNTKSDGLIEMGNGPFDASVLDPARAPSAARGSQITRYTHSYDDAGRLKSTSYAYPGRGATQTFTRDDQLRCSDVLWQVPADPNAQTLAITVNDHWSYEGGRLVSRVITNVNDPNDVRSVITYAYDADGTLAATVVDGYPDIPQPFPVARPARDGLADYVVRTVALPDGSRWLEAFELRQSNNNTTVLRNGVSTPAARWRWHFSPGCRALALPRHTGQDCEFERPFIILPLGWDNPYTAPIPASTPSPSLG